MEAKKHTPLEEWQIIVYDQSGETRINGWVTKSPELIVKAVNHHEELVEALNDLVDACYSGVMEEIRPVRDKAQELLSKLK